MPAPCNYLVVYGTLRPHFDNQYAHYLRQHSRYVGDCFFSGLLYDLGSYPGVIYQEGSDAHVQGSLYDISLDQKRILTYLDAYEGIEEDETQPTEYRRTVIPVTHQDDSIDCWVYLYNWSVLGKRVIPSGDYYQYVSLGQNYSD